MESAFIILALICPIVLRPRPFNFFSCSNQNPQRGRVQLPWSQTLEQPASGGQN